MAERAVDIFPGLDDPRMHEIACGTVLQDIAQGNWVQLSSDVTQPTVPGIPDVQSDVQRDDQSQPDGHA